MIKKIFFIILLASYFVFLVDGRNTLALESTESANILERVKEKVLKAKINPKAYMGLVTDKTGNSLQIKNTEGEIQLLSINPEEASFAKIDKQVSKASFSDIAIGDFIISLGFQSDNKVLDAKRILITAPPEKIKRQILVGEVKTIEKKQITLESKDGNTKTISFPTRWKGPEIKEIKEKMRVIVVAQENQDGKLTLRTIEILSQK